MEHIKDYYVFKIVIIKISNKNTFNQVLKVLKNMPQFPKNWLNHKVVVKIKSLPLKNGQDMGQ